MKIMKTPIKKFLKNLILASLLFVLLFAQFAEAESLASLLSKYKKAQKEYQKIREELTECRALDEECDDIEDIEEELLDAATYYARFGIEIMLLYIESRVSDDSDELDDEKTALEEALDELKYAKTKEDFDEVITKAKTAWTSAAPYIKQKTIKDLKEIVAGLVEKGRLIDAKLNCGITALETNETDTANLEDVYTSFSADINAAEAHIKKAEEVLASNGELNTALEYIKTSQLYLNNSQTALATAITSLEEQGGSLCTEVTLVEEEEAEEFEAEEEESEETETVTVEEPEEEEEERDFDSLVDEYGLEDYYDEAKEAIDDLVDYIEEKQDAGYDTSKADAILAQAEDYMEEATSLILEQEGKGALSRLFNVATTAQKGMNSEYYTKTSTSSSSSDYAAFVSCMEAASYTYKREECYDDYGISEGTQEDIETCLDVATTTNEKEECYAEAENEAEKEIDADAEELQERINILEDDLDDLEGNVTDLYDTLSDSGESSSSSSYISIDDDIDNLLDDVQETNEGYEQDLEDVQTLIDNERYDDADEDLDSLEEEIENYIEDMEEEIADIEQDINVL